MSMLAVHRTLAATGSSGETSATIASSKKAYGFSLALSSAPPSLAVTLTWTPTADTYATGYEGYRSDNPTVIGLGSPRTLSSYTDTTLGSAGATYYLPSVAGS
ncbi:MAG TPA: hypothetical protein PKB06_08910, partial [Actinotalea sp.]|nr:hypothetical protein [Actinotalea sp.]